MSCTTCDDKITAFFNKAKELQACNGYNLTQALCVGNSKKADKAERNLENIRSMSWVMSKHQAGLEQMCLCDGATTEITIQNEVIDEYLEPRDPFTGQWPETFRGSLYNPDRGTVISLVTFGETGNPLSQGHTGIRLYEWNDDVPTVIFEQDNLIHIDVGDPTSFYYSKRKKAYYIRAQDLQINPSAVPARIIKISSDNSVIFENVPYVGGQFDETVMEVVDDLNLLLVKFDTNNLLKYSLDDLSPAGVIPLGGQVFQKMTLSSCNCKVFLTGNRTNDAQIAVVDLINDTVTNLLNDSTLYNNTSVIDNCGNLLVLTVPNSFPYEMRLQKWNACCDTPNLIETINLGINMGPAIPDLLNIHGLMQDQEGNYIIQHMKESGFGALSLFNSNGEHVYTKDLNPITGGNNWGPFSTNMMPSWTNTQFVNSEGKVYVYSHANNQNGQGGTASYFLDYDSTSLSKPKAKCISLTEEEICDMIEKINCISC